MSSKKMMMGLVAALVISMAVIGCFAINDQDDSDASNVTGTYTVTVGQYSEITMYDWDCSRSWIHPYNPTQYSAYASAWDGLSMSMDGTTLKGTPTSTGTWTLPALAANNSAGDKHYCILTVAAAPIVNHTVTYNAGIGTYNGSSSFSESIQDGQYASLPSASYSTGAYTFKGWSTSSTSTTTVSSYKVTSNVTLYAVWTQNSVQISSYTATVSQGQSFTNTFTTSPSGASVSISSYGGLSSSLISLSGKTLSGTLTDVAAGTYYIKLTASYTGYKSTTTTITLKVPVVIAQPIEYTLVTGGTFSYEPVTDPSNASVSISSVTLNGSSISNHGLTVSGRTITGSLNTAGTYAITFNVIASGYISTSKTVYVSVSDPESVSDPVSISGINASVRAGSVRSYDFVAQGLSNVVGYSWSIGGSVFSSSSPTAIYQFPSAGIYTVRCTVTGADNSTAYAEVTVVCTDSYYKDRAWSGVAYGFVQTITGTPTVTISEGPFTHRTETISGSQYLVISGTPTSTNVGQTYTVTINGSSYEITVYEGQTAAPVSDFTFEIDEINPMKVTVTFTGSDASFVLFDYLGNGTYVSDTEYTYSKSGFYTINCKAVNNISERICSKSAEISVVPSAFYDFDDLTDFSIGVNEKLEIVLNTLSTETVSVSGDAADFCSVDGNKILVDPSTVGIYDLTITVTHEDLTEDSKTLKVTVTESEDQSVNVNEYFVYIIIILVLIVGLYFIFGKKNVRSGGRRR